MVCRNSIFVATYAVFIQLSATRLILESEHGWSESNECSKRTNLLKSVNINTTFEVPPPLTGKWVSPRCETKQGPQYILRRYTFYSNNTFHLIQFVYSDEACSSIMYTIATFGSYRVKSRPSSPTPTKLTYELFRVTIVVHDIEVNRDLKNKIKNECPDIAVSFWRPFTEYVIFEQQLKKNPNSKNTILSENFNDREYSKKPRTYDTYSTRTDTDPRCLLSVLNLSYEELHAVRVKTYFTINGLRHELLLAKTHLYQDRRQSIQDMFQLPLVLVEETQDCHVCNLISRSTNMFVHPLIAKPKLKLYLDGEWMSDTCEERSIHMPQTRSFGTTDERPVQLFTIRTFRANDYFQQWELETKYYSDYTCSDLIMVYQSYGTYHQDKFSETVSGAVDIDFNIDKSYLLIRKETILNRVRMDPICSYPNYWMIGVKREVPPRYACISVGITTSPVKYNIARMDSDEDGSFLLYLGDDDTIFGRPTSYRYPLVQCSSDPYNFPYSNIIKSPDSATLDHSSITVMLLTSMFWLMFSP